ncbi:hypothetical protein ASL14_00175 [Paenibacillus sp. IHB B 3084]|uniref:hypothetical protein n=1 Tax=Paenibacillus sp. IHB B 3084 TaxID=867076 RepID=UPI00071F19AB|nr:hypothetical protein [Paenibacillus sp. IHB B 3084]ALP34823.1 hypothetical protein ASL14_00175 [Paenibacillus sp. IHB B 3084]
MKFVKLTLFTMVWMMVLFFSTSHSIYAAATGDVLNKPEDGWSRYEANTPEITYLGGNWFRDNTGPITWTSPWQKSGTSLKFNFKGTKLRLISTTWWSGSSSIDVIIDGVKVNNFSLTGSDVAARKIMYEKLNLPQGEHSVEFVNNTPNYLFIYAIDTDGSLLPFKPVEVAPTPEPSEPTKPSEPSEPSKPSEPSEPSQPSGDRAILVVTMDNGLEKEFDISKKELASFIQWYDAKDAGRGASFFAIDRHTNNKGPFNSRKDYVIFNKILTFEVNEYSCEPLSKELESFSNHQDS